MTDPQQPTPEARAAISQAELDARVEWYHQNPGVPHMTALGWPYLLDRHYARSLDRFAAQREAATQARPDEARAYAYLQHLLATVAPQCDPLPDLIGLCTQIDSVIVWVKDVSAAKAWREAIDTCVEIAKKYQAEAELERHRANGEDKACWLWAFDTSNAIERDIRALSLAPQNTSEGGAVEHIDARREAFRDAEKWHWQRYTALRDSSPRSKDGLVSGMAGARMHEHREAAEHFRALAESTQQDTPEATK